MIADDPTFVLTKQQLLSLEALLHVMDHLAGDLPWSLGLAIGTIHRIVDGRSGASSGLRNVQEFAGRAMEEATLFDFLASLVVGLVRAHLEAWNGEVCPETSSSVAYLETLGQLALFGPLRSCVRASSEQSASHGHALKLTYDRFHLDSI